MGNRSNSELYRTDIAWSGWYPSQLTIDETTTTTDKRRAQCCPALALSPTSVTSHAQPSPACPIAGFSFYFVALRFSHPESSRIKRTFSSAGVPWRLT